MLHLELTTPTHRQSPASALREWLIEVQEHGAETHRNEISRAHMCSVAGAAAVERDSAYRSQQTRISVTKYVTPQCTASTVAS